MATKTATKTTAAATPPGGARKKILLMTNSDFGQSNVFLATCHALLTQTAHSVEVHVASMPVLGAAVVDVAKGAAKEREGGEDRGGRAGTTRGSASAFFPPSSITFHPIDGPTHFNAFMQPHIGIQQAWDSKPNLVNACRSVRLLPSCWLPWTPAEYASIFKQCRRVIEAIQPDLVAVDWLFSPALALCHFLASSTDEAERGLLPDWLILTPNTIKEFAWALQPNLEPFWKHPMMCSGLPYPVPWYMVPQNTAVVLTFAWTAKGNKQEATVLEYMRKNVDARISAVTVNGLASADPPPAKLRVLVSNTRELEFPLKVIPPFIQECGPIVRHAPELRDVDAPLDDWLARGPTVYVAFGTHLKATVDEAVELARAFRLFLDRAGAAGADSDGNLQILWKLRRKNGDGTQPAPDDWEGDWAEVRDILGPEIKEGRVRIVHWVVAEPASLLASGRVVCSVNHGGASSFYECIVSGVPQVILACWADTYDFANRAELLNVGRWGNKNSLPRWKTAEVATSLEAVMFGPDADAIRARAQQLARLYPEHQGRDAAARALLESVGLT